MKRDWTRPQIRLVPDHIAGGLPCFLRGVRLLFVALSCILGLPVFIYQYGPGAGLIACLGAYLLWWYHFGLRGYGWGDFTFLSNEFCLFGYTVISAATLIAVLEYFDVLKEGRPPFPGIQQQLEPYLRLAPWVGTAAFCVYMWAKRKKRNK